MAAGGRDSASYPATMPRASKRFFTRRPPPPPPRPAGSPSEHTPRPGPPPARAADGAGQRADVLSRTARRHDGGRGGRARSRRPEARGVDAVPDYGDLSRRDSLVDCEPGAVVRDAHEAVQPANHSVEEEPLPR